MKQKERGIMRSRNKEGGSGGRCQQLHLMRKLHIPGEVFCAESHRSDARAGGANFHRAHDAAGGFYPRNHAKTVVQLQRRFKSTEFGVDAAHIVGTLHLVQVRNIAVTTFGLLELLSPFR
jgi:hypothetical protein